MSRTAPTAESSAPGTASVAFAAAVLACAETAGAARAPVLAAAGLTENALADGAGRISLTALNALFAAARQQTSLAHFGLVFGQSVRTATYSGLGYAALTCTSLREAIALIPRLGRLVFDHDHTVTETSEIGTRFRLADRPLRAGVPHGPGAPNGHGAPNGPGAPIGPELADAMVAGWVAYGRWLTGRTLPMSAVSLARPTPADPAPYVQFFGVMPAFDAACNAIEFPTSYLDLPVQDANPRLHPAILLQAQAELDAALAAQGLSQRVRAVMVEHLALGEVRLATVAAVLGLSARTLQRRLGEQGERFADLLDAVRLDQARRLLSHTDWPVQDIASRLGFTDPGSFSHAFRGWTGATPQAWRQQLRSGGT